MCMTKREKALNRFYGEIKEVLMDAPEKGLAAVEKTIELAGKEQSVSITNKTGTTYTKSIPTYSVDTIKEMVRAEFFPKKMNKADEAKAFFAGLINKQGNQEEVKEPEDAKERVEK